MKLTGRQVQSFLAQPDPSVAAVLLYGPDRGLIRERSDRLLRLAVRDPEDPFVVTELRGDIAKRDSARLSDEVFALALTGERRVVVLKDADQALADAVGGILPAVAPAQILLLVEALELPPRDRLRRLFESAENAVALPCYLDEGSGLEAVITGMLKGRGLAVQPDALAYLLENLGGDRLLTRGELEKLALYKGKDAGSVSLADAEACIGDGAPHLIDDVVMAAASGDQRGLDRALGRCFQAGENAVTLLRAAGRHLDRLHVATGLIAKGRTVEEAVKSLRPPVFFKQQPIVRGQLGQWTPDRLAQALEVLLEAEIQCKSTAMPADVICQRSLMRVAMAARGRS